MKRLVEVTDWRTPEHEATHRRAPRRLALSLLVGSAVLVLTASGAARAATVHVNGTCTLREAIQTVNDQSPAPGCSFTTTPAPSGCTFTGGSDLILVPSGQFTDTGHPVTGDPIEITRSVWICGNGVGVTIVHGNSATSSFFLRMLNFDELWPANQLHVTLERMTIDHTAGYQFVTGIYAVRSELKVLKARVAGFGAGAIWGDDSNILIDDSTIENNSSNFPGAGVAFYNPTYPINFSMAATLDIYRSTLANNVSTASGGALYYDGFGNSDLVNVTFTGNSAVDGGGIFKEPRSSYLICWYTTFTKNTATNRGGGIAVIPIPGESVNQSTRLLQSIVAQNTAPTGPNVYGPISELKDSLISNTSGATLPVPPELFNALVNVSANLDPVARDLGGPYHTKVHRLLPGSPAIDAVLAPPSWADQDVEEMDQRRVHRPQFGASNASRADMGAVESDRLETEVLVVAAKSSDAHVPVSGSQYSNGQGTNLQSNAANDFVTYRTSASIPAGTYNIRIGYKKGSSGGRFQFGFATSSGGVFTPVGPTQDGYASSNSWVTVDLSLVTFTTTSTRFFRFFVTGKNASSTSYQVFPDFIELTRLP